MTWFETIGLGLMQGLLEFLPVSSSGHLILLRDLFNITFTNTLAYDAVLHLATLLAVITYFRRDLLVLLWTLLRILGRLPVNQKEVILIKALLIATLPAGLFGYFLESVIDTYFSQTIIVAIMFATSGLIFIFAEWQYIKKPTRRILTVKSGWYIGLFQMLSLLPGLSRSGLTIAGGMLLGLTRRESANFSFLLAIPIVAGAGLKKTVDLLVTAEPIAWSSLLVGAMVAFVTALLVIHLFLKFISSYTLWPFIWYLLSMASFVAYVHFFTAL